MPPSPNSHCQAMHEALVIFCVNAMFEHTIISRPTVMMVVMSIDSALTVLNCLLTRSQTMHRMETTAKMHDSKLMMTCRPTPSWYNANGTSNGSSNYEAQATS